MRVIFEPIGTAPRDGSWCRLYSIRHRITSHTVRWCSRGRKGPGWYNANGEHLTADHFDVWLQRPGQPSGPPSWCKMLGVDRTASEAEIRAAFRELAKEAHPDTGGTHEAMTALARARDDALTAVCGR
jgi:hypothetical protein